MTKCLSCGHLRHDLELNCPKCGSFYSTIVDDFSAEPPVEPVKLWSNVKGHLNKPKHRLFAIGITILLVIMVLFL